MKQNDVIDLVFRIIFVASVVWATMMAISYLVGCGHVIWRPDPLPDDATIREQCQAACDNMARLEYPGHDGSPGEDEIHGTADDVECWLVCESTEASGFPFHAQCIAVAGDHAEIEGCYFE